MGETNQTLDEIDRALSVAFGPQHTSWSIAKVSDANEGRGVFSRVLRAELEWNNPDHHPGPTPSSVIIKLPAVDGNGAVGRQTGAYEREALAYRSVLPSSPVAYPQPFSVLTNDNRATTLVLEDVGSTVPGFRRTDQLDGMSETDAMTVAESLARFHRYWEQSDRWAAVDVRQAPATGFDPAALQRGFEILEPRWGDILGSDEIKAFERLLDRRDDLLDDYAAQPRTTLCHGDPRADNLTFDKTNRPVLFDWQQLAISFGAADLAWLTTTSLTVTDRRHIEADLVAGYGTDMATYRHGIVLPGLAVLLLAQRETASPRATRFVATSLHRIASAVTDLLS